MSMPPGSSDEILTLKKFLGVKMTTMETIFLFIVVGAATIFALTLAYYSWQYSKDNSGA